MSKYIQKNRDEKRELELFEVIKILKRNFKDVSPVLDELDRGKAIRTRGSIITKKNV